MISRDRVRGWAHHRVTRGVVLVLLTLAAAAVSLRVFVAVDAPVGPVDTRFSVSPAVGGGTKVEVPPLGSLRLDDHAGPLRLDVRTTQLRETDARRLLKDPAGLAQLPEQVSSDVRRALLNLALRGTVVATLGAMLFIGIVYRRRRPALVAGGVTLGVLAAAVGVAAVTFNPRALEEPRYSGLLADAPGLVGDARTIAANFDRYSRQLAKLTENVGRLYDATSSLPTYSPDPNTIRVLHVSDLHDNPAAFDLIRSIVDQFHIDVILDSGDLTDFGSSAEDWTAQEAGRLGAPYVFVRGNHDSSHTQRMMARQKNVTVLDGQMRVFDGLRVFGIGDPRFTPDKRRYVNKDQDRAELRAFGERAAATARDYGPIDIAMVHDPTAGIELLGPATVVLSGHVHRRETVVEGSTVLLVQGSTGGAGLRGLEGDKPTPLTATILYFDRTTHRFQAYDEITVGGLGETSVQIERHLAPAAK